MAQDRVFAVLERLESKETQAAAYEELQRLIKVHFGRGRRFVLTSSAPLAALSASCCFVLQDLEPSALSTLLHAAGTATAKTTAWSRVHALRVAAMCCQPERCMSWRAVLAPPLLPKLLGLLVRALRDADSAVRTAAAEGFGAVAAQLLAANPGGSELTGEVKLAAANLHSCLK